MGRFDVLDSLVFEVEWTWRDVMDCMSEEDRKRFLRLPSEMQSKIISLSAHGLRKCMESGMMHGWVDVMRASIDEVGVVSFIKSMEEVCE